MPFISVQIPEELYDDLEKDSFKKALSEILARQLGKPESYCMASLSKASLMMAGGTRPAAFVDIRSIGGLSASVNKSLSSEVSFLLSSHLDVPKDRIYINFTDTLPTNWGYNGGTF
jgi:phenylpyruvate tautomerase